MKTDALIELLRETDQASPPLAVNSTDLANRVRLLARRRHRTRRAALTIGTTALLAVAMTPWMRPADVPDVLIELERLQREADARMAVVNRVIDLRNRSRQWSRARRALLKPDPLEHSRLEIDKAAFVLVYQAQRLERELNLAAPAIENYRRVVELFPNSRWTAVARRRLAELLEKKGDVS